MDPPTLLTNSDNTTRLASGSYIVPLEILVVSRRFNSGSLADTFEENGRDALT